MNVPMPLKLSIVKNGMVGAVAYNSQDGSLRLLRKEMMAENRDELLEKLETIRNVDTGIAFNP